MLLFMLQVVLTLSDLEQWTASAGASTAQFMASLCSQLQACMLRLQQQLLTELKVKQAAAAAEAEVSDFQARNC
jgi:hypothetical protein